MQQLDCSQGPRVFAFDHPALTWPEEKLLLVGVELICNIVPKTLSL